METCRVPGGGARGKACDCAAALVERLRTLINQQYQRNARLEPLQTCAEFERLIKRRDVTGIEQLFGVVTRQLKPSDAPELAELRKLAEEGRAWCLGADGERRVGCILSALREPGCVLNDLPLFARSNIDHVVVCRRGIFAIETKLRRAGANLHRDLPETARRMRQTATLAGIRLRERVRERARRRLWVFPVLVFVGDHEALPRVEGLPVLLADQLPQWLQSQPERFSKWQASQLAATARKAWLT